VDVEFYIFPFTCLVGLKKLWHDNSDDDDDENKTMMIYSSPVLERLVVKIYAYFQITCK